MNELGPVLDAIVVALAVVLCLIVSVAAARYRDVRFGFVAGALAVLGILGAVGEVTLVWPSAVPGAALGPLPASLIIVSEVLFYLSFVVARSWAPKPTRP